MDRAKWIWRQGEYGADEYAEFYDTVNYSTGKIILKISCDSNYAVYIDEKLSAFGQYADYPWYKIYDTIDLTEKVKSGKNNVKIVVWYYGENFSTYYKNRPGLWYEIYENDKLVRRSCKETLCCKSENYKSGGRKIITGQVGYSFCYDTRERKPTLLNATEIEDIAKEMHPRPVSKLNFGPFIKGQLIDEKNNLYDLSDERAGLFYIRFKSESGVKLNVSYGEHLPGGKVNRIIDHRDFSVEVIGNGQTVEYINPFRRLGARYLQAEGGGAFEIEEIGLIQTDYPVKEVPFRLKDALMQKIYDTSVRTLKLCMHEHYEDTPWREQSLYCFDSRNQMLCGYYAFREFAFAKANLKLIAEDRRADGLLSICFPSSVDLTIPSFSLHYVLAVEEYLRYSGDIRFVKSIYPRLRELIDIFLKRTENGLVPTFYGEKNYWNFYDWAEGLEGNLGRKDAIEFDLILNTLLSLALSRMETIAQKVGDRNSEYKSREAELNNAINRYFFDGEQIIYKTYENRGHISELGNALAILCGAAKNCEVQIAEKLTQNRMISCSLSLRCFVYDALLQANRKKYTGYILKDIESRYKKMLDERATTFWETEEGANAFGGAGSLCHGWSAMPVYYYHILRQGGKENVL